MATNLSTQKENLATKKTVDFIASWEGCKLTAYQDSAGIWTIGYGMTRWPDGKKVRPGDRINGGEAAAKELFKRAIQEECDRVLAIPNWKMMNDDQKTAITSFAYNLGENFYRNPGFNSITSLLDSPEKWNDQAYVERIFNLYVKSGSQTLLGLQKRRTAEAQLFYSEKSKTDSSISQSPPIIKISANKETWLKKSYTEQSSNLDATQKVRCDFNKTWNIQDITNSEPDSADIKATGHLLVNIVPGAGQWYLFKDHWDFPDDLEDWKEEIKGYPEAIRRAVERQFDRFSAYGDFNFAKAKHLYFPQRDNPIQPHATCNSSSNYAYGHFMCQALGRQYRNDENNYLKIVFDASFYRPLLGRTVKNPSIYHNVQTAAIAKYFGLNTKWMTDADLPFVKALLESGIAVVVNILHRGSVSSPRGGHVILLVDWDDKKKDFITNDPYGTLTSGYKATNGENSRVSEREFIARWQGGYRILK